MPIMARPFDISFSVSSAFAILSGCISHGLTARGPSNSFEVFMAAGTSDMKASQCW